MSQLAARSLPPATLRDTVAKLVAIRGSRQQNMSPINEGIATTVVAADRRRPKPGSASTT